MTLLYAKDKQKIFAEGVLKGMTEDVIRLSDNLDISLAEAMELLQIPAESWYDVWINLCAYLR